MSRTKINIGTTRIKLSKMFLEMGFIIEPHNIKRIYSTVKSDCARWEAFGTTEKGISVAFYSWDTMKDCVKYGFKFLSDWQDGEIAAKC